MQLCYSLSRDDEPILEIYSEIPVEIPITPKLSRTWLRRHIAAALCRSFNPPAIVKIDERVALN